MVVANELGWWGVSNGGLRRKVGKGAAERAEATAFALIGTLGGL